MEAYTYTVTIAHYNSSKLLKRMLESIPEREDIQVVVVDDGSAEYEVAEVKKLHHKNLETIFTLENHGAGYERNIALGRAKGKWLLAVDADDMFAEKAFDVLDQYRDSDCDYVCYCAKILDDDLNQVDYKPRSNSSIKAFLNEKNAETIKRFKFYNPDTWNKMVSLEFIRMNNIQWEASRVNTDVLYTYQIALCAKKFIAIPNELYLYVYGGTNSVTRKKRSIEREFLFYLQAQKRNGFFKKLGYGYPYYRYDFLYWPYLIKKRGLTDAIRFFRYRHKHWNEVEEARKAYLPYLEGEDLSRLLFDSFFHYVFEELSTMDMLNEEKYNLIVQRLNYVEKYIQSNKRIENLERNHLNRMLDFVCLVAVTGYFNPTNNASWKEKIAGMERFLNEPLVKRSIIIAYDRGGGRIDAQRRMILFLLKHKQWRAISLLGILRKHQLRSK